MCVWGGGESVGGRTCSEQESKCADVGKVGDLKPDDRVTKVSRTNNHRLDESYCNLRVSKD